MDASVLQQVGALWEALATVGAMEGLLARVHTPVLLQACAAHKSLATVTADKWALLRVCELMAQQVRAAAEATATLAAHKWPLSRVYLLVPQQVAALAEHLPTYVTTATLYCPGACAGTASAPTPGGWPADSGHYPSHTLAGILVRGVLLTSWVAGEHECM